MRIKHVGEIAKPKVICIFNYQPIIEQKFQQNIID